TGKARATTAHGATAPQQNINTLANALAGCIDTSSSSSPQCLRLLACATPGATFDSGQCTGGTDVPPADTLEAASTIAYNPRHVSIDGLMNVAAQPLPFLPQLPTAPNDFSMPVSYGGFNQPHGIAIDAEGNPWVANSNTVGTNANRVTEIRRTDFFSFDNANTNGAPFSGPFGIAIDAGARLRITNRAGNTVTSLSAEEFGVVGTVGDDSLQTPGDVATDANSNFWVVNEDDTAAPAVTMRSTTGALVDTFSNSDTPGANFNQPRRLAIDSQARTWVTNRGGHSVTRFNRERTDVENFNDSTFMGTSAAAAFTARFIPNFAAPPADPTDLNSPEGIAIDQNDNAWVANFGNDSVSAITPTGALLGHFSNNNVPDSAFRLPFGVAVDSANDIVVSNDDSITMVFPDGSEADNLRPPGANFLGARRLAIDSSGNVWVTNFDGGTVTEL